MRYLACLICALLAGCGTVKGQFTNRAACSMDRQEAYVCSFYGPLCIGARIDQRDAQVMCKEPK